MEPLTQEQKDYLQSPAFKAYQLKMKRLHDNQVRKAHAANNWNCNCKICNPS